VSDTGTFHIRTNGQLVTVAGEGALTLYVAPALRSLLRDAIASGGDVAVDFSHADYIDTAILMALIDSGKALRSVGRTLVVSITENSHPQYVLKITGLDGLLDIVVTETVGAGGRE
jgi:anti-anti-sigma factor